MTAIVRCPLPENAVLQKYRQLPGCYTDCYQASVDGCYDFPRYIQVFYTSWLFNLERWILDKLASKPSTDREAAMLSNGEIDRFAAWRVETREENQLLMCDYHDRTRSWFMLEQIPGQTSTLYFGSAVTPVVDHKTGKRTLGIAFTALLGFHQLYSRALLKIAVRRLKQDPGKITH